MIIFITNMVCVGVASGILWFKYGPHIGTAALLFGISQVSP